MFCFGSSVSWAIHGRMMGWVSFDIETSGTLPEYGFQAWRVASHEALEMLRQDNDKLLSN
jgi:hypothetical protein